MKKNWAFILILFFLLPIAIAQQAEVDKAIKCLEDKIDDGKCSSLSTEEKIFSLLAVQKCESELLSDSKNSYECWPKSGCTIKQTAQAILALDSVGTSTAKSQTWLSSQTIISSDILWYLQIDSSEQTSCSISYAGSSYSIIIDENKKINTHAGDCLRLAQEDYWLRIPSNCYDKEFEISCDKSFKSGLIFKQTTSPIFYISEKMNSGSANSKIKEKINSKCFSTTEICDYEGTLWTALTLKNLGKDVSPYIPYLITSAVKNERYLPESFLYILAGSSYYEELLSKQKNKQYWDESGDKLYDTALALYPLQSESSEDKTASINWILDNQKSDGCWDNLRNTGFILHSVWPVKSSGEECTTSGGYCMPEADCEGNILSGTCTGSLKCCSQPLELESCSKMEGIICDSDKTCEGSEVTSFDTDECCLGSCVTPSEEETTGCSENKGTCKISCGDDEEEQNYDCKYYNDVCCVGKQGSYWYIWILAILIILIVVAIIFRDKLKFYGHQLFSKFGKPSHPPIQPPSQPPSRMTGIPRRRFLPSEISRPSVRKPSPLAKPREELDEVLKKLKEIGK